MGDLQTSQHRIFAFRLNCTMHVLFAGKDDFSYNRTVILEAGLNKISGVTYDKFTFDSYRNYDKDLWGAKQEEADAIYIPTMRHSDVAFIRKKTKKPIVFDPLISKYLTRTKDHGKWWTAPEKYWRDWIAVKNCDVLLMDTQAHLDYMIEHYHFDRSKTAVVPIGADMQKFRPTSNKFADEKYHVGFYGGFVPLQGVDRIVEAARILQNEKDISFDIIGYGPFFNAVKKKAAGLENIDFVGWVDYDELGKRIDQFDISLGVFGTSLKTDIVIPNKIYHYAALSKCIITKDTPGLKENFVDQKNIYLVKNRPEHIAEAILDCKENPDKANKIGRAGYELVNEKYNEVEVAKSFAKALELTKN